MSEPVPHFKRMARIMRARVFGTVTRLLFPLAGSVATCSPRGSPTGSARASDARPATPLSPTRWRRSSTSFRPSAYPAGADRAGRLIVRRAGASVLALADVVLALAPNVWIVMAGVVLWGGVHTSLA